VSRQPDDRHDAAGRRAARRTGHAAGRVTVSAGSDDPGTSGPARPFPIAETGAAGCAMRLNVRKAFCELPSGATT
jgi:hypothetical protein